jgi:hypothetical protein
LAHEKLIPIHDMLTGLLPISDLLSDRPVELGLI